jgi:hypothetical protein
MLTLVFAVVAILAVAVAAYSWWHASKWAKLISYGRIVIEYKGKVKIDAPLREWALWCEQTRKDKAQPERMRGHVMYVMGGTRIALFSGSRPPKVKPLKSRREHVIQRTKDAAKETSRNLRGTDGPQGAPGDKRSESTDRSPRGTGSGAR